MKEFNLYYKSWLVTLLLFGCILIASINVIAQDKERTRIRLEYYKLSTGEKNVVVTLTAGRGRSAQRVPDADIMLTASANDSTAELVTLKTDSEGIMSINIVSDFKFPVDEEGYTVFEASFDGNDTLRSSDNDLEVKDIELAFSFDIKDSIKMASVFAYEIKDGEKTPVEEVEILVGVQRLYSVLPIDEVETDEDGVGVIEFPDDLPGDSEGMITIVAKIDEHDEYATVEKTADVAWGVPVSYEVNHLSRQLWTDEAPLWMIFSVFIILAGAWYHFFLSISKVMKIKKAAKDTTMT
ncbi:hypothetical protein ACFLU5_02025 [Bacteroidota bacterium]